MTNLTKIYVPLENSSWHGFIGEWLWVEKIKGNKYRVENSPFYVYGINYKDVVSQKNIDGIPTFDKIILRGGHSTYRILFKEGSTHQDFIQIWVQFEELGCTYKYTGEDFPLVYAVDVPQYADIYLIYKLLDSGEKMGFYHFEEGHCGHTLKA
jgi:hypothetical protein